MKASRIIQIVVVGVIVVCYLGISAYYLSRGEQNTSEKESEIRQKINELKSELTRLEILNNKIKGNPEKIHDPAISNALNKDHSLQNVIGHDVPKRDAPVILPDTHKFDHVSIKREKASAIINTNPIKNPGIIVNIYLRWRTDDLTRRYIFRPTEKRPLAAFKSQCARCGRNRWIWNSKSCTSTH